MSSWRPLTVLAVIVVFAGCSSGDDAEDAGARATTTEATAGDTDADTEGVSAGDTGDGAGQPADRLVLVRNLVTEDEADDAIELLADEGFDGFVRQPSSNLHPTATEGWDVVRPDLTAREANQLVVAIATDLEVPYVGTILVAGDADTDADDGGGDDASGASSLPTGTAAVTIGAHS